MKFREFVLEEGDLLDAVKHGFKAGMKAFAKKREAQTKKQESKSLATRVLDAEGKELECLIKQIVDNGFSIQREIKPQSMTDWLKECTNTKTKSDSAKSSRPTYAPCLT
jgi:hypothetical protein